MANSDDAGLIPAEQDVAQEAARYYFGPEDHPLKKERRCG
jgi:hypothetical protein